MNSAVIIGANRQDGSYLAELLVEKDYEIPGVKGRSNGFSTGRVDSIYPDSRDSAADLFLHFADFGDVSSLSNLLYGIQPGEVYNAATQSHVCVNFNIPEYTSDFLATGALRFIEAIRQTGVRTSLYRASSSEMFGSACPPQSETKIFYLRSLFACSKLFAHSVGLNDRESHNILAASAILLNREPTRRGETFVNRKIARAAAHSKPGLNKMLCLGNIDAPRDWGCAPENVEAMWPILQQDSPDDHVSGTGESFQASPVETRTRIGHWSKKCSELGFTRQVRKKLQPC